MPILVSRPIVHFVNCNTHPLSRRLNKFEALSNDLLDLFVLVLQQAQGIGDIVPLPLVLCSWEPGSELRSELLRVFVLTCVSFVINLLYVSPHTFSINPAKNLTILLKASSFKVLSALNTLNISTN